MAENTNRRFGDLPEDPLNAFIHEQNNPSYLDAGELEYDRICQEAELANLYDSIAYSAARERLQKFINADSESMAEFFETNEELKILFSGLASNIETVCLLGSKIPYEENGTITLSSDSNIMVMSGDTRIITLPGDSRDFRFKSIPEENLFWCGWNAKYPGRPSELVADAYLPLPGNVDDSSIYAIKRPISFDEKKSHRYNPLIDSIPHKKGYIDTISFMVSNLIDISTDE